MGFFGETWRRATDTNIPTEPKAAVTLDNPVNNPDRIVTDMFEDDVTKTEGTSRRSKVIPFLATVSLIRRVPSGLPLMSTTVLMRISST